jgi:hypothetical protein
MEWLRASSKMEGGKPNASLKEFSACAIDNKIVIHLHGQAKGCKEKGSISLRRLGLPSAAAEKVKGWDGVPGIYCRGLKRIPKR